MPSPPINRQAQGLLALLDIRSIGKNPGALSEFVQPTIDLSPFYLVSAISTYSLTPTGGKIPAASISGSGVALGQNGGPDQLPLNVLGLVQVPQDEMWYIDQVTSLLTFLPAASDAGVVFPYYSTAGSINVNALTSNALSGIATSTAGRSRSYAQTNVRPYLVPPGSIFGAFLAEWISTSDLSYSVSLRLARLRV